MLADTVGFISDLPHQLVAAFRATLEEVREADLLLHIRDISHPDTLEQKDDVLHVLKSLLSDETIASQLLEVWNKADCLEVMPEGNTLAVSALTGYGLEHLLATLDTKFQDLLLKTLEVSLPASDGEKIAWLYQHGSVLSSLENEGFMEMSVNLNQENLARWEKMQ